MMFKPSLKNTAVLRAMGVRTAGAPTPPSGRTDSLPVGRFITMGTHREAPTEGAWGERKIADLLNARQRVSIPV
jgi:hypothetical protein